MLPCRSIHQLSPPLLSSLHFLGFCTAIDNVSHIWDIQFRETGSFPSESSGRDSSFSRRGKKGAWEGHPRFTERSCVKPAALSTNTVDCRWSRGIKNEGSCWNPQNPLLHQIRSRYVDLSRFRQEDAENIVARYRTRPEADKGNA